MTDRTPFYITTAINYPNGKPHIGHAYEGVAADVIARFRRSQGYDVRFQTGVDVHGLKMVKTAREKGMEPAAFAAEMTPHFTELCERYAISFDRFISTSEEANHVAAQEIWRRMEARGDLYRDRYEGWYSVRDEAFYAEGELLDGEGKTKLSPQGTPVEWTVEESWFFRLSSYQQKLLELYAEQPEFIQPDSRRNEVIRFVEGGLNDLSISRTSFDWGVKVPGDPAHVMYVWIDALTNYLSGLGFPDDAEGLVSKYWPADVHLIGKDIVRFHAVYWPAILMSSGVALPKQVNAHGFILNRGQKESKSLGNVTDPIALVDRFGADAIRYFLMRDVSFGQDGSISDEAIVTRANADLANSFGNLAQRTLSMIHKNLGGVLSRDWQQNDADRELYALVEQACGTELADAFERFAFSQGLEAWMRAVFACNQYVDDQAPWTLKKTDPDRMVAVLNQLFICLRTLAIAIAPVIPESATRLLDQMGVIERDWQNLDGSMAWFETRVRDGAALEKPIGIFPRLELEEAADAGR